MSTRAAAPLLLVVALVPWLTVTLRDRGASERLALRHTATATLGEIIHASALHVRSARADEDPCPAAAGPTPPLPVACEDGEEGRCRPRRASQPPRAGDYPAALWLADDGWRALGVRLSEPSPFHFALASEPLEGGGACRIFARASADLDGDGEAETIEAAATIDRRGALVDQRWSLRGASTP
ncbi:MAG: hypothetical protein H6710_14785 [Myxococcales bacterium]|nr:hypothetical protein [Myxococcales bacterium]